MATPPDPSKPDSPAPHYEQPNWQVQGTVINTPGPVHIGRPKQPPPPPDPNRIKMLKQARQQVDDVLHTSLWNEAKIALRLAKDTARPYNVDLQAPERPPVLLPEDTPITEVYDQYQHQNLLLILGEPGGGKTTLLLELGEQLLGRAEVDVAHPIPVVFNLSTWGKEKPAIHDWMADQLHSIYRVPKEIGIPWVEDGQILPLLDGLDEVDGERRAACVAAINAYRANHAGAWATPMVVCCRSEEYRTLPALQGATAITVQVLTHAEIDAYLTGGGQHLDGVRTVLRDDPTLYDLLKTPLLLSIIALAFADTPAEDLRTATTPEQRKQAIFAAFVRRMFATEPPGRGEDACYSRRRILTGLRWLARQMDVRRLTLYQMELMQPDWVEGYWSRWLVRWSTACVFGLSIGLGTGLIGGLFNGFVMGLLCIIGGGSVFNLSANIIQPVDYLRFSWSSFFRSRKTILSSQMSAYIRGVERMLLIMSLIILMIYTSISIFKFGLFGVLIGVLIGIMVNSLMALMFSVLVFGGLFGLDYIVLGKYFTPNEGIRYSLRNMVLVYLSGLFVTVLFYMVIDGTLNGRTNTLVNGLVSGLVLCLPLALQYGGTAVIRHYTLRLLLVQSGAMPWNIAAMLDAAARRSLLRRVGGGWVFTHRMLLEYFRDLSDKELEELVRG